MFFVETFHKGKFVPEFRVKRLRAVPDNIQAAASRRPVDAEGGDNEVASGFQRPAELINIFLAGFR